MQYAVFTNNQSKNMWTPPLIRNMNCAITYIYVHKKLSCLWQVHPWFKDMQIVHTIIIGGGENVSDFICDANELISGNCMVRYCVRDLTNQSQGGGRGPHGVQWEPPQSVPLPSGFVEARSVAD